MHIRDQGAHPRRFIKRTHNRNPTLHSYQMLGVLHPDPVPENLDFESPRGNHSMKPSFFFNGVSVCELPSGKKSISNSCISSQNTQNLAERAQKSAKRGYLSEGYLPVPRARSTNKIELDSLYLAEDEFLKNKLRNPYNYISGGRFQSQSKIQSQSTLDVTSLLKNRSISQTQNAHYNIITNMSHL